MCEASEWLSYCCKKKIINTIEEQHVHGRTKRGTVHHEGYTKDQASQDIRAEDVIQAANSVWYMRAEIRTWQEKTTAGIPTYGNCTTCYWGGPVGMVCTHCKSKGEKRPTYQVLKVGQKILGSHWVMGYLRKATRSPGLTGSTGGYEPVWFRYPHSENLPRW